MTDAPITATTRRQPTPLLVTMGDACGIGPELIVRAWREGRLDDAVVIGAPAMFERVARLLGVALPIEIVTTTAFCDAERPRTAGPALRLLVPEGLPADLADTSLGQIDARAGATAARCIEAAVALVRSGAGSAIVTAPIHKEALSAAGVPFPGHTEMLQALAVDEGAPLPPVRMMLANDELRTVLVTIHVALRRAIELIDRDRVLTTLRIAHEAAARWGQPKPRIAVAGLNPHAGEGGLFGDEELQIIGPAIDAARAEGIDATGPYAPDTIFMRARHAPPEHPGEFDLVIAMTHDHGLIPVKYLGVEHGVNVTLGLPFVRTSPDHGTAFDLAGTGRADPRSLYAAITMARRLCGAER